MTQEEYIDHTKEKVLEAAYHFEMMKVHRIQFDENGNRLLVSDKDYYLDGLRFQLEMRISEMFRAMTIPDNPNFSPPRS